MHTKNIIVKNIKNILLKKGLKFVFFDNSKLRKINIIFVKKTKKMSKNLKSPILSWLKSFHIYLGPKTS